MSEVKFIDVYYNLSQALIGLITDNIKAITFKFNNKESFWEIKVFTKKEVTDIDRENIFDAVSEAEGMFSKRINYEIDFVVKEDKINSADKLDVWIFICWDPGMK